MAIGMAVFVLAIASTFLILQGAILPSGGFSEEVSSAAHYALDRFHDQTDWTLYVQPVFIHADTALSDEPLELRTPFDPAAVPDSLVYVRDRQELVSQQDVADNTSVVVTDIRNGTTRLDLVYTIDHDLPERTYDGIEQAGNSTWNDELNVTFTDSGFQQITFNGSDFLTADASIGASSSPIFVSEPVQTNVTFAEAERKEVRVFDGSGKIRVQETFTGEAVWTFNLTDNFTAMYSSADGGTTDLSGSGILYQNATDFVDFYNNSGFGFIGEDLFVTVSRETTSSPVDVRINFTDDNGEKNLLLYAHDGDYTSAVPQKRNFFSPYRVSMGLPVTVTGVSRSRAAALEGKEYERVQELLGLVGTDYNITVGDVFRKGRPITPGTTVQVFAFPAPIVDRFANATVHDLRMRVWNR